MLTSLFLLFDPQSKPADYNKELTEFRTQYEAGLKQPNGWLTVAGLTWVREGENTIGSAEGNDVKLPSRKPAKLGSLTRNGDKVTLHVAPGSKVTVDNEPASGDVELRLDQAENGPSTVKIDDFSFYLIKRSYRIGVRMNDPQSENLKNFKGCVWYKPNPKYKVTATWTPHNPPQQIMITNVLGDTTPNPNSGYVTFTIGGKKMTMEAIDEGGEILFFIFRDKTTGGETYGAGRFLNARPPKDGKVELDFNYATNPPCAFTAFATCPLPPKENSLPIKIEAGERFAGHH